MNQSKVYHPGRLLIVEDDLVLGRAIQRGLMQKGHSAELVTTGSGLRSYLERRIPELILLDLTLPDESGLGLLPWIKTLDEDISVMIITGDSEVSTVVEAMKRGADHFLAKPFSMGQLQAEVENRIAAHRIHRRARVIRDRSLKPSEEVLPEMVGSSSPMARVRDLVLRVAEAESSVLLLGESGTGKGLLARGIHQLSRRSAGAFVELNCASIQTQLLESEIFGHERGAFTGALNRKPGLMEIADGGTLFLDEIAEMDIGAQGKLLKALEDHCFRRIGGTKEINSDFRLIAATNHDLEKDLKAGKFREDLYYRLNVFQIRMPPLRERHEDILKLAPHFIRTLNPLVGRQIRKISAEALRLLQSYHWPGNVRELRNVIERSMILARGTELKTEHLPETFRNSPSQDSRGPKSLEEVEREHILRTLDMLGGNIRKAAGILGISRSTLYAKMEKYQLKRPMG